MRAWVSLSKKNIVVHNVELVHKVGSTSNSEYGKRPPSQALPIAGSAQHHLYMQSKAAQFMRPGRRGSPESPSAENAWPVDFLDAISGVHGLSSALASACLGFGLLIFSFFCRL